MNLPELIETYGYWVVLGGTLLEGESVLCSPASRRTAATSNCRPWIGVAMLGSFVGDQLWFLLGPLPGREAARRVPRS